MLRQADFPGPRISARIVISFSLCLHFVSTAALSCLYSWKLCLLPHFSLKNTPVLIPAGSFLFLSSDFRCIILTHLVAAVSNLLRYVMHWCICISDSAPPVNISSSLSSSVSLQPCQSSQSFALDAIDSLVRCGILVMEEVRRIFICFSKLLHNLMLCSFKLLFDPLNFDTLLNLYSS